MHDIGVGMVSSAAKQQKTQVLCTDRDIEYLEIHFGQWRLSPPSFTHTSV